MDIQKKSITLIICLLIIIISFSGCISPTKVESLLRDADRSPGNPTLNIDANGNVHIFWCITGPGSPKILYTKINNSNILINKKSISSKWMANTKSIVDSMNNIHLFYLSKIHSEEYWKIYYTKLDNQGKVLINSKILTITSITDIFGSSRYFDISLDHKENLNILWLNDNSGNAGYIKLDNNGTIIVEKSLYDFFYNFELGGLDWPVISLHIAVNSKNILHAIWEGGYNHLNLENLSFKRINEKITGKDIAIDTKDIIYILTSKNITKFDINGTILSSEAISNITIIPNHLIIMSNDGNYLNLGYNGCLDSDNNLHFWSIKVESEIVGRDEENYHTIYYNKIGINGTVLINNLVIDSDRESSWEEQIDAMGIAIIFMIAIPILVAIIIIIHWYFKKSKQDNEKR